MNKGETDALTSHRHVDNGNKTINKFEFCAFKRPFILQNILRYCIDQMQITLRRDRIF